MVADHPVAVAGREGGQRDREGYMLGSKPEGVRMGRPTAKMFWRGDPGEVTPPIELHPGEHLSRAAPEVEPRDPACPAAPAEAPGTAARSRAFVLRETVAAIAEVGAGRRRGTGAKATVRTVSGHG